MRLGDLLVAARLVTTAQVEEALSLQRSSGRRIGEILVGLGALSHDGLERFLHRVPREAGSIADTGIDETVLLALVVKHIYVNRFETVPQLAEAIGLPPHVVGQLVVLATGRRLMRSLGERDKLLAYTLTEEGTRYAQDALAQSQYVGPAPVTLEAFTAMVDRQKIHNVIVTPEKIRAAFAGLVITDHFIEKIGPALNSDRAMLLYGPAGNGKSSVARCFASIFDDMIHVPYAVLVGGMIMRVFDPSVHVQAGAPSAPLKPEDRPLFRVEEPDRRWVPCRRPFIVTGGELTLEMLDLQYNAVANFYEAPLHVKALGGCFVIDDFGRQLIPPKVLLNRWIVPMESRTDTLKLHSGKSFTIPFEELLVFSTNMEPEDLMDPAFLRRLPYKLEVGAPGRETFRSILADVCRGNGLTPTDADFETIVRLITEVKKLALASYMPKFIVDQVVAMCRFLGQPPHFEPRYIEYAIDNLRVNHG